MRNWEINQKLVKIFTKYNINLPVTLDSVIEDFGFDSLDVVEIIVDLEKEFDIIISDSYFYHFNSKTINDVKNLLEDFGVVDDTIKQRLNKLKNINEIS